MLQKSSFLTNYLLEKKLKTARSSSFQDPQTSRFSFESSQTSKKSLPPEPKVPLFSVSKAQKNEKPLDFFSELLKTKQQAFEKVRSESFFLKGRDSFRKSPPKTQRILIFDQRLDRNTGKKELGWGRSIRNIRQKIEFSDVYRQRNDCNESSFKLTSFCNDGNLKERNNGNDFKRKVGDLLRESNNADNDDNNDFNNDDNSHNDFKEKFESNNSSGKFKKLLEKGKKDFKRSFERTNNNGNDNQRNLKSEFKEKFENIVGKPKHRFLLEDTSFEQKNSENGVSDMENFKQNDSNCNQNLTKGIDSTRRSKESCNEYETFQKKIDSITSAFKQKGKNQETRSHTSLEKKEKDVNYGTNFKQNCNPPNFQPFENKALIDPPNLSQRNISNIPNEPIIKQNSHSFIGSISNRRHTGSFGLEILEKNRKNQENSCFRSKNGPKKEEIWSFWERTASKTFHEKIMKHNEKYETSFKKEDPCNEKINENKEKSDRIFRLLQQTLSKISNNRENLMFLPQKTYPDTQKKEEGRFLPETSGNEPQFFKKQEKTKKKAEIEAQFKDKMAGNFEEIEKNNKNNKWKQENNMFSEAKDWEMERNALKTSENEDKFVKIKEKINGINVKTILGKPTKNLDYPLKPRKNANLKKGVEVLCCFFAQKQRILKKVGVQTIIFWFYRMKYQEIERKLAFLALVCQKIRKKTVFWGFLKLKYSFKTSFFIKSHKIRDDSRGYLINFTELPSSPSFNGQNGLCERKNYNAEDKKEKKQIFIEIANSDDEFSFENKENLSFEMKTVKKNAKNKENIEKNKPFLRQKISERLEKEGFYKGKAPRKAAIVYK